MWTFPVVLRVMRRHRDKYHCNSLPYAGSLFSLFSTNALQIESDFIGVEKEERDFDLLIRSRTKMDHAKCHHAQLLVSGKAQNKFFSTRLVNLYLHLGDVFLSRCTFNWIPKKDVFIWNCMMSSYVRCGFFSAAIDCYRKFLLSSGLRPDFYTFPPLLKACGNVLEGKRFHCSIMKLGFQSDVFVAASLVHMYARHGYLGVARQVFDDMPFRDIGSWNAMISGYCQNGNAAEALDILSAMKSQGIKMDSVTVCSLLAIFAQFDDALSGILIHVYIIKHGLEFDLFVNNALINMYAKFSNLGDAQQIFESMVVKDVVSWNSIIAAYEQNNDPVTACLFFKEMQSTGLKPDLLTVVSLASSFAQVNDSRNSKSLHCFTLRRGWVLKDVVLGNAVVDMYAKLGYVGYALQVFEELPAKDVISWNTLITGYAQNGLASEAIEAYHLMEECEGIPPNEGTSVSILTACASAGALKEGMRIHALISRNGLIADIFVGTCLIDMYGKCGRLDDAMSLFYDIPRNTSVPWNAIISCHGLHGHGDKALKLFEEMQKEGVEPDHITFVSLLSACSHAGLVDEGQRSFQVMQEKYGIKPGLKHYGCMVDLLARAGLIEKAYDFIQNMPIRPDASVWGALLGACRIHGNAELGTLASDRLFEVDPENVGYHVLLSNIYANAGKWDVMGEVRSFARDRGLRKTPGWSSIEVNNTFEVFYTGNQTHPKYEEIHNELWILTAKMKGLGYIPDFRFVLQDVEDDEKEDILTSHSERLAIAFGIISTFPKSPLRIFKNLRVCGDCHIATKLISLITEREIIVRDSNRFHHFKDGICSCGDYW